VQTKSEAHFALSEDPLDQPVRDLLPNNEKCGLPCRHRPLVDRLLHHGHVLKCGGERLLERRTKRAQFRDSQKTLDNFDFTFNKKMNRSLLFDLAAGSFIARHEDALFLGPPGTGKSHLGQAIGQATIQQGYRVLYREIHTLFDELAEATRDGTRKEHMEFSVTMPLGSLRLTCCCGC
jgi:DNA replication protein DnaC